MNRAEFLAIARSHLQYAYDAQQVEIAYLLAKKFHAGQLRRELGPDGKPLPYFHHPRRVALRLLANGFRDATSICGGLLHDTIEDTADKDLICALIRKAFGDGTYRVVRAVTKVAGTPGDDYLNFLAEESYYTDGACVAVKLADRIDNLETLPVDDPEFCARQRLETREKYMPIFTRSYKHVRALGAAAVLGYGDMLQQVALLAREP